MSMSARSPCSSAGEVPIHEPGLDAVVKRNSEAGRLRFTTDAEEGVEHGLFQLIAVGTPPDEDGSADLRYVLAVARTIGEHMSRVQGRDHQVDRAGRHRRQGARARCAQSLAARGAASSSTRSRTPNS